MEARQFADWLRQQEAAAPTEPRLPVVPREEYAVVSRDEHEQEAADWYKFAVAMLFLMLFLQVAMLLLVGVLVWAVLSK